MIKETPSSQVSTIAEKVFQWWDYCLYIPLTALRVGTIIYFLFYWFSCNDWVRDHRVSLPHATS